MITYEAIKHNDAIRTYIERADDSLKVLGYTEHSFAHVCKAAETAGELLSSLGYDTRTVELAKIAGYMHDIGNLVNRSEHSQSGAVMAFRILDKLGMEADEIATVVSAIGVPVNAVAAALILADKADVRRSRVRNFDDVSIDIHDRVNYSVTSSELTLNNTHTHLTLKLTVDTHYSSVMEYFEIFLERMLLCCKAADHLGLVFKLVINDQPLI